MVVPLKNLTKIVWTLNDGHFNLRTISNPILSGFSMAKKRWLPKLFGFQMPS
jgi:hypothetical protein